MRGGSMSVFFGIFLLTFFSECSLLVESRISGNLVISVYFLLGSLDSSVYFKY